MKKIIVILLFLTPKLHAAELLLSPFYGYGSSHFYGQTEVAGYRGSHYGAAIEYKAGWKNFSFGIYGQYSEGDFDNTNNNETQKEFLETQNMTAGLKFYFPVIYLKLGYGINKTKDRSEGTVSKIIDLKESLYQTGVGASIPITGYLSFFIEAEVNYSKYKPEFGGLTRETELLNYMGVAGFNILIPSYISGVKK